MKLGVIPVLLALCFPVYVTKDELKPLLFHCPSRTEWSFRAKWYCKANGGFPEENYACLYNELKNISTENCNIKPPILEKGEQYILRHNPVGIECKERSRYQPFRFTEFSSECAFLRSMCSEPGHVRYHEGTSVADKSCRCNFEEGYAFVSKPQKNCYCIPSREDCSCYKKNCPTDYVVNSDYHCIHKNNKSHTADCPDMNSQQKSNSDEMKYPRPNDDHNEKVPDFQRKTLKIVGAIGLLIIVIAVILSVLNVFDKIWIHEINPPIGLQIDASTGCLKLCWSVVKNKDIKIHKYKVLYTHNDWENTSIQFVQHVEGTECVITNILPLKTYKFTVACCCENSVESKPSEEKKYISGTPNPPRLLSTVVKDGNLILKWKSPEEGLFTADAYKIVSRWNENSQGVTKVVNATASSQIIPYIRPDETYTFTIASCVKNIAGHPSEQLIAINPRDELIAGNPSDELITGNTSEELIADNPSEELIASNHSDELITGNTSEELIASNHSDELITGNTSEELIASNHSDELITGNPSEELEFYSGVPNEPAALQAYCIDSGIRLIWTAPAEGLFKTESYYIEVTTCPNWEDKKGFSVPACLLEYSITDFIIDKTYRFKIYAVSGSVRSKATDQTLLTSPSWYLGLLLNAKVPKSVFEDKNCQDFKHLSGYFKKLIKEVCQSLPGEQSVMNDDYSEGSFYAAFILVSKGFYDEEALRSTFENIIKTGNFGRFSVSMDRFCFKFLDKPLPPKFVDVENIDTTVQISWSQPPKTFFKTQQYVLQVTTDKWESFEEHTIPVDECQYSVLDVLPSTTYSFKMYTAVKYFIKSLPSNEMSALTKGPIPPNNIEIRPINNGIMISWNKPNYPALCHIKQYLITVKEGENMYTRTIGKNETTLTMTDLKSSATYGVHVSTISTNGHESDHSKLVEYKTKDALQKEEEENYQKLSHLVHDVAFCSIKKKFEREYTQLDIEKILNEHKSHLSLTDEQMRILYSQSGTNIWHISTITNDMELMMDIILRLKKCPKDHTKHGFKLPNDDEYGDIAELQRVEYYRREIKNSKTCRIPKTEFDKCFSTVTDTIKRIDEANLPDLQQLQSKLNAIQGHTLANQEQIINTSKHQTEIDATEHVLEVNQTKGSDTLDLHQLIIDTWEIENERFKKTKVVDDILLSLKKTNCITITGMPGEGKTALMHHVALVLHKTAQFSIVPCSVATDINHFYKKDKNQIFVIDDVCGKYIIDQYLVNSFIYNESFHRLILKKGNSKFISTCRKQIFQEKKFQQLQYLIGKAFDISTDYPMSDEEKLLIANEYLSPNAVKRIQGYLQSYSFFPLMCRLCHKKPANRCSEIL